MAKHFTKGVVIGRITEIKDEETRDNKKKYVTIQIDVSSTLSGDVTAYCRLYEKGGNIEELKRLWEQGKQSLFKVQGMYSQYRKDESAPFLSSFTLFDFEPAPADSRRRAYFIVVGEVSYQPSQMTDGGQRFLVTTRKTGSNDQEQEELFEFWSPGEKLLPSVALGDLVRVKGLVRQMEPDGICGGDGPIRAWLESIEIHAPEAAGE